jgi:hypothetical protein
VRLRLLDPPIKRWRGLITCAALLLTATLANAATWYVNPDASGNGSGTSWGNAITALTKVNDNVRSGDTCFFYGRIRGTGQTPLKPASGYVSGSDTIRTYYVCGNGVDDTWLMDRSASIWGSDSITGWIPYDTSGAENIWRASDGGNGVTYTLAQIDGSHDTLLTGDPNGIPTKEGYFHWSNGSIYAWFLDDVNPNSADIEAAWNDDETVQYSGTNYTTLYGLDLRYGSPVVYFTSNKSTYNQFFYCTIRGAGGCDGCNTACVHSKYGGSHPSADADWRTATISGYGNYFKLCTIGLARKEEGSYGPDNESALDFYSQWGYVIESCYVTPSQYNGLKVKSESRDGVMRFNTVDFTSRSSDGAGIYYYCSYQRDSLYGNTIIGNTSNGIGIYLRACEVGANDDRGNGDPNDEPMFVCNNTIYNIGHKGIFTGYGNDEHDWKGRGKIKYNIIHTIPSLDKIAQLGPVEGATPGIDTAYWIVDSNAYYVSQSLNDAFAIATTRLNWDQWQNADLDEGTTMWYDAASAGFADPANGDFSRPSAPQEIQTPWTAAGVTFTRYGAVQSSTPRTPRPQHAGPENGSTVYNQFGTINGNDTAYFPVTLIWFAVEGADSFRVWIDTTSNFRSNPKIVYETTTQLSFSDSSLLENGGDQPTTYYWKVQAYSDSGGPSAWSDPWTFKLDDTLPPADPSPLQQTNPGADDGQIDVGWILPGDDGFFGYARRHEVWYAEEPLSQTNLTTAGTRYPFEHTPLLGGQVQSLTVTGLEKGRQYFLAVRAVDNRGLTSPLATAGPVFAAGIAPPEYRSPTGSVNDSSVALNCDTVFSYLSPLVYEFQVSDNRDFQPYGRVLGIEQGDGTVHADFEGLDPDSWHFTRCRAYNDASGTYSDWSNTWQFNLQGESTRVPPAPVPHSPENGETVSGLTPVLEVLNAVDLDGDRLTYEFELYDNTDGPLLAQSGSVPESPESTAWTVPDSICENTRRYAWRARAFDGLAYSDWTDLTVFIAFEAGTGGLSAPLNQTHPDRNPFLPARDSDVRFVNVPDGASLLLTSLDRGVVRRWSNVTTGEITWDGTNESGYAVSSGVYPWYVEGTGVKGKLILIR